MSQTLAAVLRLAPAPRARVALAAVLGALTILFGVGLMALAGYLIARAAEHPPVLSLMIAITAVRFFGLGRPVIRYGERLFSHDLALRVLGRVRARFYERIEPLAPAELDSYRQGDLLSRMVSDVDALQNVYLRGLGPVLVAVVAGAVSAGVAAAFLPAAGLVLAGGLLVAGVAVPVCSGVLGRPGGRQAEARGALSADIVELIRGAGELVAFGREPAELARVRASDDVLVRLGRRDAVVAGLGDGLTLLVAGGTVAGVLAVTIDASAHGRLDHVLIAVLALLALASFEAVTPLAGAARDLAATLAAGRRVAELTDQDAAVSDPEHPVPAPRWPFAIELQSVRAAYPHQPRPALNGVSFSLAAGEKVALVGPSGAGKTTIVNLLLRFLDPETGRVTLGGRDLREYSLTDVRRTIAVAGQESHLFSVSIAQNVRLGRPEATDTEVADALRRARIWEWVQALPDGLATQVGEEGRELSGGQRQRILLARALLAGSPVLVLDEPTAHLDPATATELMRDVFSAAQDQTVLLITHRREGLDLVDRIHTLAGPTTHDGDVP
ncbi:MAG: thiol reductant ABC exporter subunit CydC [Solirubrobacteraceae bacterium]